MSRRAILLLIGFLSISAQVANAGPANRTSGSGTNVPINLNGFGAPLPGVTQNGSDLEHVQTGQMNFKEVETLPQVENAVQV